MNIYLLLATSDRIKIRVIIKVNKSLKFHKRALVLSKYLIFFSKVTKVNSFHWVCFDYFLVIKKLNYIFDRVEIKFTYILRGRSQWHDLSRAIECIQVHLSASECTIQFVCTQMHLTVFECT